MRIRSDDLLVLLAVERHRTFTAAARHLEIDHTTVARRIQALSRAVGGRVLVDSGGGWELTQLGLELSTAARSVEAAVISIDTTVPDGGSSLRGLVRVTAPEIFMNRVVTRAVAAVCREHPRLLCELVSVTRPTPQHGPTGDLDIGVTRSRSRRLSSTHLLDYRLGLYASVDYLREHDPIAAREDLAGHVPVYYVESMLQVEDLDRIDDFFPQRNGLLGATSVSAQVELVRAGAGIGILPAYLADDDHALVPVLRSSVGVTLTYWMTSRPSNLRRPEVSAVANAIRGEALRIRRPAVRRNRPPEA
ncbi:MAG: LysR family transcriptional regulator [Nocardioidaceae bacterium]